MRRRKTINSIIILIIVLMSIGLGYAFLTQDLTINGISKVKGNTWDIHFENLVVNENSVTAIESAEIDTEDTTTINYSVRLNKPGDFYEFTVDVSNSGTLPGIINLVTIQGAENCSVADYTIKYTYAGNIGVGDLLNAGTKKNITVRFYYKMDIDAEDLSTIETTLNLSFVLEYVQADEEEENPEYILPAGAACYQEASGTSRYLGVLPAGTETTIQDVDGGWVQVEREGENSCWIFGWLNDGLADILGLQHPTEKTVTIFSDRRTQMEVGELIHLTSYIEGFDGCELRYVWQYDDGSGFQNAENGNQDHYECPVTLETFGYSWRLQVLYRNCPSS